MWTCKKTYNKDWRHAREQNKTKTFSEIPLQAPISALAQVIPDSAVMLYLLLLVIDLTQNSLPLMLILFGYR
jgi:hypothetical protein